MRSLRGGQGGQRRGTRLVCCTLAVVAVGWPAVAPAVIIQTTTGTGNTTAPPDDPGWSAVGFLGIGTGVYVGDGWVLTAAHVGAGPITLAGTTYQPAAGSSVRLTNGGGAGLSAETDLVMYRLTTIPTGIAGVPIAAATPALGTPVTMIGAGRDRQPGLTEWSVNTAVDPWIWTEVTAGGNAAGYKATSTRSLRWGTNALSGTGEWISYGLGDVKSIVTTFDDLRGTAEAQASYGDSGGGVFAKRGSAWELAGLMVVVDGYSGQPDPGSTAVFGDVTYSVDLSYYRPQIVALVPEPSALMLVALGGGVAWLFHRRRRRR